MDGEIIKRAVDAAPILAISLGAVLLMVRWSLNFLRDERAADGAKIGAAVTVLSNEVAKLGTTVAEFSGRVIEAVNNSAAALRDIGRKSTP